MRSLIIEKRITKNLNPYSFIGLTVDNICKNCLNVFSIDNGKSNKDTKEILCSKCGAESFPII